VVPLSDGSTIAGVFDVDSPQLARFTAADKAGLERLTDVFLKTTPLPPSPTAPPASKRAVLNERIDIQTCRDHHVVLRYLVEEIGKPDVQPDASLGLLKRLRTVLLAHLKLEDDWLYPHLQRSVNDVVRHKSQTYSREMGGLKENFVTLWQTWTRPNAIADNSEAWRSDWNTFQKGLLERMDREDHDLYVAAEASLVTPNE
ncbi:MAG: hemerythrin domain-containing protein, partial [Candidatus Eremiobacteraeota bacterium]|nr:hemerythrin domain-containing protein [Candidatus Eremiobacteraeota bacterium]